MARTRILAARAAFVVCALLWTGAQAPAQAAGDLWEAAPPLGLPAERSAVDRAIPKVEGRRSDAMARMRPAPRVAAGRDAARRFDSDAAFVTWFFDDAPTGAARQADLFVKSRRPVRTPGGGR